MRLAAMVFHMHRELSHLRFRYSASYMCVLGAGRKVGRREDEKESSCQENGRSRGPAQA